MKDTFTDSDSIQQTERRAARLLKKSGALATTALVGASLMHNNPQEFDVHAVPMPGYILRDTNGDIAPAISPGHTVTLASSGLGAAEAFYPNHPVAQETTRKEARYCTVVDVPLAREYSASEIKKGAATEFALSTERYKELQKEIFAAKDIAEVQQIIALVIEGYGITAKFDGPISPNYVPIPKKVENIELLQTYTIGMNSVLQALAMMPREMLTNTRSINFLNAEIFGGDRHDPSKKQIAKGTWNSDSHEMTLAVLGIGPGTIVHEAAHAMHEKACKGFSDAELKREYNAMTAYLFTNPETSEIESRFRKKEGAAQKDPVGYSDYIKQGISVGYVTDYTRENFLELMGDLSEEIICYNGYIPDATTNALQLDMARRVREMAVERLQKAMPNVDVPAYLEYVNAYRQTLPSELDPKDVIKYRVSPMDGTFAAYNYMFKRNQANWKMTPIIAVHGKDGDADQYIYAYQDKNSTQVIINTSGVGGDTEGLLVSAAAEYLKSLPGNQGRRLEIDHTNTATNRGEAIKLAINTREE